MGRSVSYASGSVHVAFSHFERDGDDEDQARWDWVCACDDFIATMQRAFPSLDTCDQWLDFEDHVLLRNAYARFGVSEYAGLVSMWVVPVEAGWNAAPSFVALRDRWIGSIAARFFQSARQCFGEPLIREGFMSNGVGVYRHAAAAG